MQNDAMLSFVLGPLNNKQSSVQPEPSRFKRLNPTYFTAEILYSNVNCFAFFHVLF